MPVCLSFRHCPEDIARTAQPFGTKLVTFNSNTQPTFCFCPSSLAWKKENSLLWLVGENNKTVWCKIQIRFSVICAWYLEWACACVCCTFFTVWTLCLKVMHIYVYISVYVVSWTAVRHHTGVASLLYIYNNHPDEAWCSGKSYFWIVCFHGLTPAMALRAFILIIYQI